jgi:hypothetical protein
MKILQSTAIKACPALGKKPLAISLSLSFFLSQQAEDKASIRIKLQLPGVVQHIQINKCNTAHL